MGDAVRAAFGLSGSSSCCSCGRLGCSPSSSSSCPRRDHDRGSIGLDVPEVVAVVLRVVIRREE